MAIEEVASQLVVEIGQVALWLQAIGIVIALWIIFQIVNFIINRKRMQEVYMIKKDMKRIEGKIDRILSKKGR